MLIKKLSTARCISSLCHKELRAPNAQLLKFRPDSEDKNPHDRRCICPEMSNYLSNDLELGMRFENWTHIIRALIFDLAWHND